MHYQITRRCYTGIFVTILLPNTVLKVMRHYAFAPILLVEQSVGILKYYQARYL